MPTARRAVRAVDLVLLRELRAARWRWRTSRPRRRRRMATREREPESPRRRRRPRRWSPAPAGRRHANTSPRIAISRGSENSSPSVNSRNTTPNSASVCRGLVASSQPSACGPERPCRRAGTRGSAAGAERRRPTTTDERQPVRSSRTSSSTLCSRAVALTHACRPMLASDDEVDREQQVSFQAFSTTRATACGSRAMRMSDLPKLDAAPRRRGGRAVQAWSWHARRSARGRHRPAWQRIRLLARPAAWDPCDGERAGASALRVSRGAGASEPLAGIGPMPVRRSGALRSPHTRACGLETRRTDLVRTPSTCSASSAPSPPGRPHLGSLKRLRLPSVVRHVYETGIHRRADRLADRVPDRRDRRLHRCAAAAEVRRRDLRRRPRHSLACCASSACS